MADSTPLLADFDDNPPNISTSNQEFNAQTGTPSEPVPASAHFKRPTTTLTIIILVCSIITVALLIANGVIVTWGPFTMYRWIMDDALSATVGLGIFVRLTPLFFRFPFRPFHKPVHETNTLSRYSSPSSCQSLISASIFRFC